jgi:hypothetical protein
VVRNIDRELRLKVFVPIKAIVPKGDYRSRYNPASACFAGMPDHHVKLVICQLGQILIINNYEFYFFFRSRLISQE